MKETIDVTIERSGEQVFLVFNFENVLKMNLTSNNQEEMKIFFQKLIAKLFNDYTSSEKEYALNFKDCDGSDLFHDVAEKYVSSLNSEIQSIYSRMN